MPAKTHWAKAALHVGADLAFHVNKDRGRTDVYHANGDNANHSVDEEGDDAVEVFGLDVCGQIFCQARNPFTDKVANRMCY